MTASRPAQPQTALIRRHEIQADAVSRHRQVERLEGLTLLPGPTGCSRRDVPVLPSRIGDTGSQASAPETSPLAPIVTMI